MALVNFSHITLVSNYFSKFAYLFFFSVLGTLRTRAPLDREEQDEFEVWISVSDGDLSSLTPVYVTVTDVNDNTPEFMESTYRVTVPARSKTKKRESLFRVSQPRDEL